MPIIALAPVVTTGSLELTETLEWHDATDVVTTLTGSDIILQPGWLGGDMPPYSLSTADLPGDGAVERGVRALSRQLFFPLYIEADTHLGVRAKIRALASALNPKRGDGHVHVLATDGGRRIAARYLSGMEGDTGVDAAGMHWQMYGLNFTALDPMWLDLTDQSNQWQAANVVQFFDLDLDGRQLLTQDSVLGSLLIGNPGDEDSYPVWTIAGSMTAATFTNNDTGETFTLTYTQTTGYVTIDCHPGQLTVVNQAGTNLWVDLAVNPVLWALHPGDNAISLVVSGTDGTTLVTLQYTPRYLTS